MPRKTQKFQVGNYPPGRLPFGFQASTPVGRNKQPNNINFRPRMGKGTVNITADTAVVPYNPNNGQQRSKKSTGRGSSKLLSMSDFLGNQPFQVAASYGKTMKSKMQQLNADANSCIIAHRELLIPNLAGSTSFTVQGTYSLNPGLASLSAWLAAIASDYEEYEFLEFGLEYITRSPTSSKGSIGICFDYDPADPPPASELEASQMVGTMESNVWKDFTIRSNTANMRGNSKRKFVRSGPSLGDIKNYDSGTFSVYTNDCADSSSIGKIWMFYRVKLTTPQSPNKPIIPPATCTQFINASAQLFTTGVEQAIAFPVTQFNPLLVNLNGSYDTFTPPAGAFRITADCAFKDSANEVLSVQLRLLKNGVQVGQYATNSATVGANGSVGTSLNVLTTANGTDTFQIAATCTGAAGTLHSVSGYGSLIITIC